MSRPAESLENIAELIDAFGGATSYSAVIGKRPSTASEMKRRGRIPVEYWPETISAAPDHGITGLNSDIMVRLHVGGSRHSPGAAINSPIPVLSE